MVTQNELYSEPLVRGSRSENDTIANDLQYFHDFCMVRTPEIQGVAAVDGNRRQLADSVRRILLPGARKSHRFLPVHSSPAEDHL